MTSLTQSQIDILYFEVQKHKKLSKEYYSNNDLSIEDKLKEERDLSANVLVKILDNFFNQNYFSKEG